jgi:hypothetical protein
MTLKSSLFAMLISMGVALVCIGVIYLGARLFHMPGHEIAPYFVLGMITAHITEHAFKD